MFGEMRDTFGKTDGAAVKDFWYKLLNLDFYQFYTNGP